MASRLPQPLESLVAQLSRLPGLGPKSAMRVAMTFLAWPEAQTRALGLAVSRLRDDLCLCSSCGAFTATDPCEICSDPGRDQETICLVAEWDSMLTLEEGGFYHGQYCILGGLLAPLEQVDSSCLAMERLSARLAEGRAEELILALGATVEGENTASYVRQYVASRFPQIRVTRLAQGIPLGAEVKFMDRETLRQSLQFRQDLR